MNYLEYLVKLYNKISIYNNIVGHLELRTMANPGWGLEINIESTFLEKKIFNNIRIENSEDDWIRARIEDKKFNAWGGLLNIQEMMFLFINWAEDSKKLTALSNESTSLEFLSNWYLKHCDSNWEHCFSSVMHTDEKGNWRLKIALNETELENKYFESIYITHSNCDWFCCEVKGSEFLGYGGPTNLPEMLDSFRGWATQLYDRGLKIYTWHDQSE